MALVPSIDKKDVNEKALPVYEKFEKETGSVPEWAKVMANRPEILKEFNELFKSVMGEGEIETKLKWKMAYTVSNALRCPFCVDVTSKMMVKMGADESEIENIKEMKNLSQEEEDILKLVKDVTDNANVDDPETFSRLRERMSDAQIVELVSVIGLFNYINRFNNTLAVLPE